MRWFGVMGTRSTASTGLLFALALAVLLASDVRVAACVYFRPGVTSTWDYTSANWLQGDALQTWVDGSDAGFDEASVGTTGTRLVTVTDTIASVNSITFSANGCTLDGGTLTLTGTTASGGYISVADGCTGVINSTLAGSGGLQKVDYGMLTLGSTNTFTGDTYVRSGTLRLANSHALQNSTHQIDSSGGTLSFGELRAATLGGLSGSGTLTLTNENSESVALSVGNNNASTTFSGELIGAADSSLVKIGSGALTLGNINTSFYGDTVLESGTLELHSDSLCCSTLDAQGGTLRCAGSFVCLGGLKGSGDLALDDVTLGVGVNSQSTTYSGTLSGSVGLKKTGSGTLTLAGANTFTGDTSDYAGTLRLANSHALQNSTYQNDFGGTLSFGELRSATLGGLNGYGTLTLTNENSESVALSVGNNNASTTFSGYLIGAADSSLVKIGSGTLTLGTPNWDFYGDTVLRNGTLELQSDSLHYSTLDAQGGTLRSAGSSVCFGGLKGSGDLALDDVTLGVGFNNQSTTYSGILSGSVGLGKVGSGTLTLDGANTFTGDIVVDSGVLAISSTGSLLLDINTQDASSAITGYGAIAFDGSLLFDLTDLSASDRWNVLAVDTLTESFGSNFGAMFLVGGNSYAAMEYEPGVWMREIDAFGTAAFSEATGILTVTMVPEPGVLTLLLTGLVGLAVYGLRKRA